MTNKPTLLLRCVDIQKKRASIPARNNPVVMVLGMPSPEKICL